MGTKKEAAALLKSAFLKKKKGHRGFSLQFLAKRLGLSAPFLSQLFNGKRALPIDQVEALCRELDLDEEKRDFLFRAVMVAKSRSARRGISQDLELRVRSEAPPWVQQPTKFFWVLEDWAYLAIINCTLLKEYAGDPAWIAGLLGLSPAQVSEAMERLEEAGFLAREADGFLRKSSRFNDFQSSVDKSVIRAFHGRGMDLAKTELINRTTQEAVEARFITTYTLTAAEEKIPWAKQKLKVCLDEIVHELAKDEGEKVYQLGVQFFPITKA